MDEHTHTILTHMLRLLEDYKKHKCTLRAMIDGLEGSFHVIEEKVPESFQSKWFIHWGNLEQILAIRSEGKYSKEIFEEVEALQNLLQETILSGW